MPGASKDHGYAFVAFQEACDKEDIDLMEQEQGEGASQILAPDTGPDR